MCLSVPGKLVEIYEEAGMKMGRIDYNGTINIACLEYVPEIEIGQYAVVHAGFAISVINEEEAAGVLMHGGSTRLLQPVTELTFSAINLKMSPRKKIRTELKDFVRKMKYLSEYRDPETAHKMLAELKKIVTRPWTIMEVCGGQTHAIVRSGINQLLPAGIELVHGPGCPVCVTPLETIDRAIEIASRPGVIFCSFGDMLRVPGSKEDLLTVRSRGGDVRVVYSALEAIKIAGENPDLQVVFFAIGFETTAPGNAMAILQAEKQGLKNFSELACHVLVPPAITALLNSPDNKVQGYLAAGHVCTIQGLDEYEVISKTYGVPIVATGLEANDILEGVLMLVRLLEAGKAEVLNQYTRLVRPEGNIHAKKAVHEVFEIADQKWRGIGEIPASGLRIRERFAQYDAARKFAVDEMHVQEPEECISGLILQGIRKPSECGAFGVLCTPEKPLGATMVSSEGACSAYYRYKSG